MSYTDAASRIGQIQDQIASLRTAFAPPAAPAASGAPSTPTTPTASGTPASSFSAALSGAMSSAPTTATTLAAPGTLPGTPGAPLAPGTPGTPGTLPARASTLLTSDQQQFASRLAADTGMDPGVVSAWLLAEESGGAATARQGAGNNDWLNIGYTDSGTFGSSDSIWSNPATAADATAGWLKGQNTIPGYGTASSGIQGILSSAGQPPAQQIAALQSSGWASSGYPSLGSLYQQVAA